MTMPCPANASQLGPPVQRAASFAGQLRACCRQPACPGDLHRLGGSGLPGASELGSSARRSQKVSWKEFAARKQGEPWQFGL